MERPVDRLPSPEARIAGSPHVSGKDGGHTLNLHQFARDGVVLLGRIEGAREGKIWLTDDLPANLAKADQFEAEILKLIDTAIEAKGLDAPEDSVPRLSDGYAAAIVRQLDLRAEGIGSVIWATGYRSDLGMVKLPVLGGDGFPVQNQGVSPHRGLYFVGMPWMPTQKTGLFLGVGENASHIADHIAGRNGRRGR
jgi:putative flavoprotein involved in K+ transport